MRSVGRHELALLVSPELEASASHVMADVRIDGVGYLLRLRIDPMEEDRRSSYRLGGVVDTGVLHALWSLRHSPSYSAHLEPRDIATLERCDPGLVVHSGGQVVRLYNPIGAVDLIAARRSAPSLAIQRALAMPPIFKRVAIWQRQNSLRTREFAVIDRARRDGVGLVESDDETAALLSYPRPAIRGVPGVYRWLVAELAYESWLQAQMAHA